MIILIGGIKGGTGKTTLATNLATIFYTEGFDVVLVDADDQKSAYDWGQQRDEKKGITVVSMIGNKIHKSLSDLDKKYDYVIVDAGGRDTATQRSALTIADICIIPFKPRSFDVWTLGTIKSLIEEIEPVNPELKFFYVINQGDSRGSDNDIAIQLLSEVSQMSFINVIGHRKAFSDAASEGLGVVEMEKRDEKAIREIIVLYDRIRS